MFNLTKQPLKFANFFHILVNRNRKLLNAVRPYVVLINYSSQMKLYGNIHSRDLLLSNSQHRIVVSRHKSKGKKKLGTGKSQIEEDDDSDEDDYDENDKDEFIEDGAVVKTYSLPSMRVDLILKQVLNQKRKKIEEYFYSNKIRVNGRVLLKKGGNAKLGDEIDLIKGFSKDNPELIDVARVEILDMEIDDSDSERILAKVKMFKNLTVDNYPEGDKWKESDIQVED